MTSAATRSGSAAPPAEGEEHPRRPARMVGGESSTFDPIRTCVGVTFEEGSEHEPLGVAAARGGRRAPAGKSRPVLDRRPAKR